MNLFKRVVCSITKINIKFKKELADSPYRRAVLFCEKEMCNKEGYCCYFPCQTDGYALSNWINSVNRFLQKKLDEKLKNKK